jgi:hypothetical protein
MPHYFALQSLPMQALQGSILVYFTPLQRDRILNRTQLAGWNLAC